MMTPQQIALQPIAKKHGISPSLIEEIYYDSKMIIESNEQIPQGSNDLHTGQTIRTYTGKYINVFDPREEDIDIEDIAHALSNVCRFAGHTHRFYSVAQHCIDVMNRAPEEYKLQALLHDAAEAYMGDLAKPIKKNIPQYKIIEYRLMDVISKKFMIDHPSNGIIKLLDHEALEWEHEHVILKREAFCMPHTMAKEKFLQAYHLHQKYGK